MNHQIKDCSVILTNIALDKNITLLDNQVMLADDRSRKKHACYVCMAKFATKLELAKHKSLHSDDETEPEDDIFEEYIPSSTDSSPSSIKSAKLCNLDSNRYVQIKPREDLAKIVETKEESKLITVEVPNRSDFPFKCETCRTFFKNLHDVKSHKYSKSCKFACRICGRFYKMFRSFVVHVIQHMRSVENKNAIAIYCCPTCDKLFSNPIHLRYHRIVAHKQSDNGLPVQSQENASNQSNNENSENSDPPPADVTERPPTEINEISCDLCYDVFESEDELTRHLEFHKQLENDRHTILIEDDEDEVIESRQNDSITTTIKKSSRPKSRKIYPIEKRTPKAIRPHPPKPSNTVPNNQLITAEIQKMLISNAEKTVNTILLTNPVNTMPSLIPIKRLQKDLVSSTQTSAVNNNLEVCKTGPLSYSVYYKDVNNVTGANTPVSSAIVSNVNQTTGFINTQVTPQIAMMQNNASVNTQLTPQFAIMQGTSAINTQEVSQTSIMQSASSVNIQGTHHMALMQSSCTANTQVMPQMAIVPNAPTVNTEVMPQMAMIQSASAVNTQITHHIAVVQSSSTVNTQGLPQMSMMPGTSAIHTKGTSQMAIVPNTSTVNTQETHQMTMMQSSSAINTQETTQIAMVQNPSTLNTQGSPQFAMVQGSSTANSPFAFLINPSVNSSLPQISNNSQSMNLNDPSTNVTYLIIPHQKHSISKKKNKMATVSKLVRVLPKPSTSKVTDIQSTSYKDEIHDAPKPIDECVPIENLPIKTDSFKESSEDGTILIDSDSSSECVDQMPNKHSVADNATAVLVKAEPKHETMSESSDENLVIDETVTETSSQNDYKVSELLAVKKFDMPDSEEEIDEKNIELPMKCTGCEVVFTRISTLKIHNSKKHKCLECNVKFCKVPSLREHYLMLHKKCYCAKCHLTFNHKRQYESHNRLVHVCPTCLLSFTDLPSHKCSVQRN